MTTQQGFLNFTSTSRPVPVKVASLVLASSQSTSIMITENTALETNNLDFRAVVMLSVGLLAAVLTFPAIIDYFTGRSMNKDGYTISSSWVLATRT
ncbi:hypothetical protein GGS24DRAFT_499905 [Hypoxylon argillaceum]|nr:hypothetical protein GGS24DRAFT_499905 [Hypoxylon argillaceum]KAI1150430.1 hypothetical protein F4825DRAFT_452506 [Nemania diffusa]